MKKLISLVMTIVLLTTFCGVVFAQEIETVDTGLDPLLIIENVEANKVVAGTDFYISFVIRNIGTGPAFNLNFNFELEDDKNNLAPFSVVEAPEIKQIESKAVQSVAIKMHVNESAANRNYKLKVNVDYKNALQTSSTIYSNVTIPVTYGITKPQFVVKAVQFEPKEPDLTQPFTTTIFFENISETDAGNVSVALDGTVNDEKNFEVVDLSNTKHLFDVKGKQTRMVSFKLEAEEPRNGNQVKITFTYDYKGTQTTQTEVLNLPLPKVSLSASGKLPWVIISKYTLSDEQVLAGNTVALRLFVENTNNKDVFNAKVSIVDVQLEDNQKGDTVFSPVDSSNTFFIEKIPGKTTVMKEIALYVDPNAQAKTYNVPIEIKYEYDNGQQNTVNERVNIPVTQECKFEILSVDVPPVAAVGQPVPVAAEFVNVGKVALTNFMVNLEGDFTKENAVYYIGNLETGMSDFYQAMAIPQTEGELQGNIVFTYIDNNNKEVRVERPFTIQVESRPEPMPGEAIGPDGRPMPIEGKPGMPGSPMGPGGPQAGLLSKLKNNWKSLILFVVVLIQGIFIWRLRRKAKSNGEFFDV
ncbi:MAG: COG1361 S-layer family protein [Bacillota bacterium]